MHACHPERSSARRQGAGALRNFREQSRIRDRNQTRGQNLSLFLSASLMYSLCAILYSSGKASSLISRTFSTRIRSSFATIQHLNLHEVQKEVPIIYGSSSTTRCFSSSSSDEVNEKGEEGNKKKPMKKKKWTINPDIDQHNADKLAQAFDELARKDGFDSSLSHFADDGTFEDDFDLEDDFEDDDEDIDFGDDGNDMDARIKAAQRQMDTGQVSVPRQLDDFASEITLDDMRKLGFKREVDPFGDDETPRKDEFKLVTDAMVCNACGADFQCRDDQKPGYLPEEKFELQVKLAKIEEVQKLKEKAESSDWSPEDEIEWLIQTSGGADSGGENTNPQDQADIDIDAMAGEMGINLDKVIGKKVICKRCHGLQNFGKVDESLRPGWTKEPLLSQEKFRNLLRPIREKPAVIIALVDLFDFSGSVLPELDSIAGDNPVIIAANKVDLLPSKMGMTRAENWVRRELEYVGVQSLANVGGAVRLVSCKTGVGIGAMLAKARSMAEELDGDIYVVGAANAGKSTLINYILNSGKDKERDVKRRAGNSSSQKGALTTSPLPGTTLKFIKVDLGQGRSLYDTPGLLVPGTLTQLLTPEELKIIVPKKKVEPISFRVASGKCVLVGGLAKVGVVGDSKPFLLTFFVANGIKLHPTDSSKAHEFVLKHAGEMLTPPLEPGPERMEQIGEFITHTIDIEGMGWKEAAADITLTGLGWVAVTGAGTAQIEISVPKGIGVSVRPPLMPFDVWEVSAKYTGSRAVRKSTKSKTGKRRKGVGRN